MKKLLLLLCVMLNVTLYAAQPSVENYYNDLYKLTPAQKEVLFKVYNKGKLYNKENTLSTIAWIESTLGYKLTSPSDGKFGSYGVFHALLEETLKAHGLKPTKENKAAMIKRLTEDLDFATQEAVRELNMWQGVYKNKANVNKHVIASYNAGTNGLSKDAGKKYLQDFKLRSKAIDKFFKNKDNIASLEKITSQS